jgi:SRSO17 transposase
MEGLIRAEKRNMERMEEAIPEANEQSLQHFISNSDWDTEAVIKQVGIEANKLIGDKNDAALLI